MLSLADTFYFNRRIDFGLLIDDPPAYLGCSFRVNARVIDEPVRYITQKHYLYEASDIIKVFHTGEGEVRFSIWTDKSCTERLADTGWIKWKCRLPLSMKEAQLQNGLINTVYGGKYINVP